MRALQKDNCSGLCEVVDVMTDGDGIPVGQYGYVYDRPRDPEERTTFIAGWESLDGACDVWRHCSGSHDLLIPVNHG